MKLHRCSTYRYEVKNDKGSCLGGSCSYLIRKNLWLYCVRCDGTKKHMVSSILITLIQVIGNTRISVYRRRWPQVIDPDRFVWVTVSRFKRVCRWDIGFFKSLIFYLFWDSYLDKISALWKTACFFTTHKLQSISNNYIKTMGFGVEGIAPSHGLQDRPCQYVRYRTDCGYFCS